MVECARLEIWCTFTGTVGSNPTLSAKKDRARKGAVFVLLNKM